MEPNEPGSKLLVLGMVIQPLIGNPFNGYINPYHWVDDHPLLYGNNGSLDPSTNTVLGMRLDSLSSFSDNMTGCPRSNSPSSNMKV